MSRPAISYPIPSPHSNSTPPIAIPSSSSGDPFAGQQLSIDTGSYQRAPTPTSGRPSNGQARGPTTTLDSYITRLLVVTKQLLQGLEQWSQRALNEDAVSDIYVRLGNGFEMCVTMFRRAGISTADLDSVPNDLREILERALAEEPNQETLNMYLPDIRAIIFNLLNGLKNKQISYKRLLADRQKPPEGIGAAPSRPPRQHTPIDNMEARSIRSLTSDGPASPASGSTHLPAPRPPAAALAERSQQRGAPSGGRAAPPPDAFRPARPRTPADSTSPSGRRNESSLSNSSAENRRAMVDLSYTPPQNTTVVLDRPPSRGNSLTERASRASSGQHVTSRFSADSDVSAISSLRPPSDGSVATKPIPIPSPNAQQLSVPFTATTPTVHIDLSQDDVVPVAVKSTPDNLHPTARSSLALLQKSEALERRASKRFSSYTFNKMLPTSSPSGRKTQSGIGSPPRPARRSDRIPAMPSLIEDQSALAGAKEELQLSLSNESTSSFQTAVALGSSLQTAGLPSVAGRALDSGEGGESPVKGTSSASLMPTPKTPPTSLTAFLQLGRQVKKATIDLPLTTSALRLLFMERFEYDPGMEDFPNVYIRDNKTGVQYELEDMDDVTDGCVLALDFEPLDQVKQHFDLTFASLAQDIKELKTSLAQAKRQSVQVAPSLLAVSPTLPTMPPPATPEPVPTARMPAQPSLRTPSGTALPAADLKPHYEEVQNLRRDLAILRQLHVDFLTQTKESFGALRTQNSAMKEIVKTKMGGNRALLDNSKAKLEGQCQDTIQAVEEVSDIIDGAREDALRRGITPSRTHMDKIRADLASSTSLVDSFASDVTLAEPTWRATWLIELQRVTEEQRLLAYQNKLAADLKNDIKDATEMLDNVQAFIDQRQTTGGRSGSKKFQPPPPDEGTSGIGNLLLEIRTKEADPTQRLRAIEERQKARERDLANRTDEFQDELSGFVQGRKLRKTGGTDEADRVLQRRQDQTIRRMMSDDGPQSTSPSVISPQGTGPKQRVASDGKH